MTLCAYHPIFARISSLLVQMDYGLPNSFLFSNLVVRQQFSDSLANSLCMN